MPMPVLWPMPKVRRLEQASSISVPERETIRTLPVEESPGMMPILQSPSLDHTRAVRSDQERLRIPQRRLHLDHVDDRDALGDTNDELHARVLRLEDGIRAKAAGTKSCSRWRPSSRPPRPRW